MWQTALRNPNQTLVNGIRSGRLSPAEFEDLNRRRNDIARLKQEAKLGPMQAAALEHQYAALERQYLAEDVYIPGESCREPGRFYNGVKSGEISDREASCFLQQERANQAPSSSSMETLRKWGRQQQHLNHITNNCERDISYYYKKQPQEPVYRGFGVPPHLRPRRPGKLWILWRSSRIPQALKNIHPIRPPVKWCSEPGPIKPQLFGQA